MQSKEQVKANDAGGATNSDREHSPMNLDLSPRNRQDPSTHRLKIGHCPSCHAVEAQFSRSQWKKGSGMRNCIKCVAVGIDKDTSLLDDHKMMVR
jgi:hypothetical protein